MAYSSLVLSHSFLYFSKKSFDLFPIGRANDADDSDKKLIKVSHKPHPQEAFMF